MELSYAQREGILNKKLRELTAEGWQVESATATGASVMFPKIKGSLFANLLLTIFTAGLWLFVWVAAWLLNPIPRDKHARVDVDEAGVIHFTKLGIFGAKTTEDRTYAVQAAYQAGEYEIPPVSESHGPAPQGMLQTGWESAGKPSFEVTHDPTASGASEVGKVLANISGRRNLVLLKGRGALEIQVGIFKPTTERSLPLYDITHVNIGSSNEVTIYDSQGEKFVTTAEGSKKKAEKIVAQLQTTSSGV